MKIVAIVLVVVTLAAANDKASDVNCKWIYRCCQRVGTSCVEICEPEIFCDEEKTTQEPTSFAVITAPCGSGKRPDRNEKCRNPI